MYQVKQMTQAEGKRCLYKGEPCIVGVWDNSSKNYYYCSFYEKGFVWLTKANLEHLLVLEKQEWETIWKEKKLPLVF